MSDKFLHMGKKETKAAIAHREELLREAEMFAQHSEWRKEAEREQIAKHAWKDGKGWFGDNNETFEEYWQQKQKEQEPVLGREARMQHLRDEIKELLAEDEEQDDKR